jgi:hypothetical protein
MNKFLSDFLILNCPNLIKKTVYFFVGESKIKNVIISNEHLSFKWLNIKDIYLSFMLL